MNLQIDGFLYFEQKDIKELFPDEYKALHDEATLIKKASHGFKNALHSYLVDVENSIDFDDSVNTRNPNDPAPRCREKLKNAVNAIREKLHKASGEYIHFVPKGNSWIFAIRYQGLITLSQKGKRLFNKLEKNLKELDSTNIDQDIHLYPHNPVKPWW